MDKLNTKNALIINDITCYGKVSSLATIPVMTKYGIHPYILPTAVVSNTMDYGSSVIMDTSNFIIDCINKWKEFGFSFNNISTGLINNSKQADIIINLINSIDEPFVLVDPIMADNGELYPGMYTDAPSCYRLLASKANIITPNFTEACMLTHKFEGRKTLSLIEYNELSNAVLGLGAKAVVISGCRDDNGQSFNFVHRGCDEKGVPVFYEELPYCFIGTGDVFSACIFSEIICGADIFEAVKRASDLVYKIITANISNPDHFDLRIETVL